jgi:hypothetical protein
LAEALKKPSKTWQLALLICELSDRPDRSPDLQAASQESRYQYAKEDLDNPRFKHLFTSFTSASYFSVVLARTPVKRGICGFTSVHKLERLIQNLVFERPPFPSPPDTSSAHCSTLLGCRAL